MVRTVIGSVIQFYRDRSIVASVITISLFLGLVGAITNGLGFSHKSVRDWLDVMIFPVAPGVGIPSRRASQAVEGAR
jgi:hypothetical protein